MLQRGLPMESLSNKFQEYVSSLKNLPGFDEVSKNLQAEKEGVIAVQILKDFGESLKNKTGATEIEVRIGKELQEKAAIEGRLLRKRKAEGVAGAHEAKRQKRVSPKRIEKVFREKIAPRKRKPKSELVMPQAKRPKKKEPLSFRSSLPAYDICTIASMLSFEDQEALAESQQSENVTKGIALARLSYLESVSASASQAVRDEFYLRTGQQFPSLASISKMRMERERIMLGKQKLENDEEKKEEAEKQLHTIDQEIKDLLQLLENTASASRDALPDSVQNLCSLTSTKIDFQQPQAILEALSISHEYNLAVVGEVIGVANLSACTTPEALAAAAQAAVQALAANDPPRTEIVLSGKEMTSIPLELTKCKTLVRLDLSRNRIGFVPKEIGNMAELSFLDLSDNKISALPREIGNLANLTSLNLSNNRFSFVPGEIRNLSKLTSLDLSSNEISSVPIEITNLSELITLDLSGNHISTVPGEIGRLANLTTLGLANNNILMMPGEIGKLANLTTLDLALNHIKTVPGEIGKLKGLISLKLSDNDISKLPDEIGNLKNLQKLDLKHNPLKALSRAFSNLEGLKELDIVGDEIKDWPDQLESLTNLSILHVNTNSFTLSSRVLEKMTKLAEIFCSPDQLQDDPIAKGKFLTPGMEIEMERADKSPPPLKLRIGF